MKRNPFTFLIILAFACSCGQPKLTKETASEQIIKAYYTPAKYYDLWIYGADTTFAKKMRDSELVKEGLVKIPDNFRGSQLGSNLVTFTEKSEPFKLATSVDLQKSGIQIVKVANFKFGEVTQIRDQGNGQPVEVEYTQVSDVLNGFAKLANYNFSKAKTKTVRFTYDKENGYQIEHKAKN